MEVTLQLQPRPESARQAREAVASLLERSRLEALRDTALLLTSEVVTNAILHARTELVVTVAVEPPRLRVEVADDDERRPEARPAAADATSGRGIMLVEMLADEWGVRPSGAGKAVWFEVGG